MRKEANIIVLKFGSSVLRSESDLASAVHEIYRHWREGLQVIAVVSAVGNTTDELLKRAQSLSAQPDKSALAALLATGEAASSALLGLALNRSGIAARVLDAVQAGLRTAGGRLDADPVAIDSARILAEAKRAIVVLPGFVGRDEDGDTTLLGRGGSDYSALFVAHKLSAQCILVKDVDGLYTSDPACKTIRAKRFSKVSYETAARVGGAVVQLKAVRFAEAQRLCFSITRIGAAKVTEVGSFIDSFDNEEIPGQPLRVALLGCGTVGGGVYERLAAHPELFTVTGVGSRTRERASSLTIPRGLVTSDLEELVEKPCDVVVELIGGTKRASSLVEWSLGSGRDVVTANKALIASRGEALEVLAAKNGAAIRYSAAVGGVLPALEAIKRARRTGSLKGFAGVLNGTCNFVLDRLATGEDMSTAVRAAQELGYAEARPQMDLKGIDAAQKLVLLARAAFAERLTLESVSCKGIEGLTPENLVQVAQEGQVVRLIASCQRTPQGIKAAVEPVALRFDHPLAQTTGVENRLIIEPAVGEPWLISGTGAGRWPTTESVMADLLDLNREKQILAAGEGLEDLEECVA